MPEKNSLMQKQLRGTQKEKSGLSDTDAGILLLNTVNGLNPRILATVDRVV